MAHFYLFPRDFSKWGEFILPAFAIGLLNRFEFVCFALRAQKLFQALRRVQ
jgi:hypothetical protein